MLAPIAFFGLLKRNPGALIRRNLLLTTIFMTGVRALCFFSVLNPRVFADSQAEPVSRRPAARVAAGVAAA